VVDAVNVITGVFCFKAEQVVEEGVVAKTLPENLSAKLSTEVTVGVSG